MRPQAAPPHSPHPAAFSRIAKTFCLLVLVLSVLAVGPAGAQERSAIHKVPPIYPALARQMGITGTVLVNTTVDASGKVIKVESTSGNKLLANSAIDAVKQWKFAAGEGIDTFTVSICFVKD